MPLDITEQAKKQCGYKAATASEFPNVGSDRPNLHHIKFCVRKYEKFCNTNLKTFDRKHPKKTDACRQTFKVQISCFILPMPFICGLIAQIYNFYIHLITF
jgi:hypothetical protein